MNTWIPEADGVFRGGGVKGLAIASALTGFAQHDRFPITRWVNVAGASAGAIIAGYLAVKDAEGVQGLQDLLEHQDFARFADFPRGSRVLGCVNLVRNHGMARGERFLEWFDELLGGATFAQVQRDDGTGSRLKLVAVDVTGAHLLVLPDDLALYRQTPDGPPIDPLTFSIAKAARMSMSIPYFFEPVTLYRDGADGTPQAATIVDGGTLSNFPVWIFDVDPREAGRDPVRHTFGFTLSGGKGILPDNPALARLLPWPVRFGADIFHTAQTAWDARFASYSTRVRTLAIDAADVGTTEFRLSDAKKRQLIANGRAGAKRFLDHFDPERTPNTYGARPVRSGD